jgi:hypothetical protein
LDRREVAFPPIPFGGGRIFPWLLAVVIFLSAKILFFIEVSLVVNTGIIDFSK